MRSIRVWKSGPDGAGPEPYELPEGVRYVHVFHHVAAQGPPPVEVARGGPAPPAPPARQAGRWVGVIHGLVGFALALAVVGGVAALYRGSPPKPPPPPPVKTSGYADVVLSFSDGLAGPISGPYGRDRDGKHPEKVSERVVLRAPFEGPRTFENREAAWLSLPTGSFVVVGFRDLEVRDGPGPDLIIHSLESAGEQAEVFVRSQDGGFQSLGRITQGEAAALDLAKIRFTGTVHAVKIVGLDCLGSSPGFDLVSVEAPGPKPATTAGSSHKH